MNGADRLQLPVHVTGFNRIAERMAGVFRSMISDNGRPVIGDAAKMLGVRPNFDIPVEPAGIVKPGTGGLSVAPDWRRLPFFLIPTRLNSVMKEARGNNRLACFRLTGAPFESCQIDELLALRPESANHGIIEPSREMLIEHFQDALAATQEMWVVDET